MKYNYLIFLLFVTLLTSCASYDDVSTPGENPEEQEETIKLFSKSEFTFQGESYVSKEYFYNDNQQIDSIRISEPSYITDNYSIDYNDEGDVISIIKERFLDYDSSTEIIDYSEINFTQNKIELISEEEVIEIYYTGDYVDSTKLFNPQYPDNIFEQTFTRNSENNLIEENTGGDVFEYSGFDTGKKLDPSGSGMEYEYGEYFDIFNLKVTANNPTTIYYSVGGEEGTYSTDLEYDEEGYVITSKYEGSDDFAEHFYSEL